MATRVILLLLPILALMAISCGGRLRPKVAWPPESCHGQCFRDELCGQKCEARNYCPAAQGFEDAKQ